MMNEFESLKVGDKVFVRRSNMTTNDYVETSVVKTTKTQITTANGYKFYKDNGDCVGERTKERGTFHFLTLSK